MWDRAGAAASRVARCAAGASLIIAAAGCGGRGEPTGVCVPLPEGVGYRPPSASALQHSLVVPGRVHVGDSVPLLLTLRNRGDSTIAVEGEVHERVEFIVTRRLDSAVIWRAYPDVMVAILFDTDTMRPGATRTFRETWGQRDDSGRAVPPGTYCVYGFLLHNPPVPSPAPPATLTIDP